MPIRYGLTPKTWQAAKAELRGLLEECARVHNVITYGEVAPLIRSAPLGPRSPALFALLNELCIEDYSAGRGLIAVLVVKAGDLQPGEGFFKQASRLARDTRDQAACVAAETRRVFGEYS